MTSAKRGPPRWFTESEIESLCNKRIANPSNLTWCGCGDGYPADSFEAGVMSIKGKCSNCTASQPADHFAGAGKAMEGAADKDEQRLTLINSLRASKSWTTDYATAYVDDYFDSLNSTT